MLIGLFYRRCIAITLAMLIPAGPLFAQQSGDATDRSAVILMYHRFGEDRYPSTNIKMEQFRAHLEILKEGGFNVVSVGTIVRAARDGKRLPSRTIAITVDDAYRSFLTEAWPLLKQYGFPASLFVATDSVDSEYGGILNWDEIRQLKEEGVEIGHHGAGHIHMIDAGVPAALDDIQRASERFDTELGVVPPVLAYPYGEYSEALSKSLDDLGFAGALAQYSGAYGLDEDRFTIPRFALNERFGDADRFGLLANSRAMPRQDVVPVDPVLTEGEPNPPSYGFTVGENVIGLSGMNCFASNWPEPLTPMILDRRVEIRVPEPFPPGRQRITCTKPGPGGRWYWAGKFFYVPGGVLD